MQIFDLKKAIAGIAEQLPSSLSAAYYYRGFEEVCDPLSYSREKLLELQSERLKWLMRIAARQPFYRERGATADAIESFPIIDKRMILSSSVGGPVRRLASPTIRTATSGSTGEPFEFIRTLNDVRRERLYVLRNFWRYGYRPGELLGAIRSYVPDRADGPKIKHTKLQNVMWFSAYHMDEANLSEYVRMLRSHHIRFILAYPSSAYVISRYLVDRRETLDGVRALFLSSEKMMPAWLKLIQKAFPNAEIIDRYGTAELSNSFTLCSICGGYHINEDYGFTEFVPIEGQDNRYEIVGSGFLNAAYPMVRYRVGDTVRIDALRDAKCGFASQVLVGEIEGRSSDLICADGKLLPGVNFFTLFHAFDHEIAQFQLVQTQKDSLLVRLVLQPGSTRSRDLEDRVRQQLRRRVGSAMEIEFNYSEQIERDTTTGKVKAILSSVTV